MRSLRPFLFVGLLLVAGLLMGCEKQQPQMQNQPPDQKSDETKIKQKGMKKPIGWIE